MDMKKNNSFKKKTIKKVLGYIRNYRMLLVLSLLLAAMSVALTLVVPVLIGDAIDCIIEEGSVDFERIAQYISIIAVIIGATAVIQWVMNTVNNRITYNVVRDVRNEAFEKIEALPLKYIDTHAYGETVNRVISDADQFADGLLMGFTQFFTGLMTIIGTLIFMIRIDLKIALAVVVLTPVSLFAARFISKKTYTMFRKQAETKGEETALIEETIGNLSVVQAFSQEKNVTERFDEINGRLKECSQRAVFFSSLTNPTTRFLNSIVYAVVALIGALSVLSGGISVGSLSCILSYANQYTKPFNEISGVITELQNALASAGHLFELIEEKPETQESDTAPELDNVNGNIKIENVSFSYTPEKPLIRNFDLTVEKGEKIAIVGPTGCGKTTLINLLMRFYDVDEGRITVDSHDIRDITRHSLRRSYGMVLQDTWLRNGTVRENIAIGKPDATMDEIITAAKKSHAHSFIKRLPQGYDTVISEDGGSLSEGQKQLLCITRVMLCLPPMLILDEATSSIDTRTEVRIQEAFGKLMEGKTSFIVAHRLSTIMEADVILVMKNGNVIEKGRHEELLKKKGFYYELYNSQFVQNEA